MDQGVKKQSKFYWHANTSSGGTLSLGLDFEGELSKKEKEELVAHGIAQCYVIVMRWRIR